MKNQIEIQKCFHSNVHDKHREKKVVTFAMQKFYLDTRLLSVSGNTKEGLKIWGGQVEIQGFLNGEGFSSIPVHFWGYNCPIPYPFAHRSGGPAKQVLTPRLHTTEDQVNACQSRDHLPIMSTKVTCAITANIFITTTPRTTFILMTQGSKANKEQAFSLVKINVQLYQNF